MFTKLTTDKARSTLKPLNGSVLFAFTAYFTNIDTGMTQIGGYVNAGDRRHTQTWILQLTQQEMGDFCLE